MNRFFGCLVVLAFLGLPSSGLAQENKPNNQEQDKKAVESNTQKDNQVRFGIGFNQTLFSEYGPPDIGVRGVTPSSYYTIKNRKEIELRLISKSTAVGPSSGKTSGGNAYQVISWQEFSFSDKGNFPSESVLANLSAEDRQTLADNWVAYGRGMALRYAYLDELWKAKSLRVYVGPEIGMFFRHESLRFKDGQDKDNYRRGLSAGLKVGLNLLVTKNLLFYADYGGRFNFVTDVEVANIKTGIVYIF